MYEHRHDNIAGICNQKIDFGPSSVTTNAQIPSCCIALSCRGGVCARRDLHGSRQTGTDL